MQLMPGTARKYGVRDAFDPGENLLAGAKHLRGLLDEFGGDLTLALAAYNAGSAAVRRHGGVPAYPETRNYVRKVREKLGKRPPGSAAPAAAEPAADPVRLVRNSDGSILLAN
jgi:soluble lytic murein transglycosylase-like protein